MDSITGLAPSGSLGSGYNIEAFKRGLSLNPHFIGQDAGSTDMGPYYHGTGRTFLPRATYKHDLAIMLKAARAARIPLLVGSVLTSGCDETLEMGLDIIREIAKEEGLSFRMAAISSEIPKAELKRRMAAAPFESIGPEGTLTDEILDRCGPICAQMGSEPFVKALDAGAEVIIAGRACDDSVFAALPVLKGFDTGLSLHCGKILECAGLSAIPYDLGEPMLGTIHKDNFIVEPGNAAHRCTTVSVAGHSLYERGDFEFQPGPGGLNDLSQAVFEQIDERRVRVSGSRFVPDAQYKVKLEGAEQVGFRSIVIVGIRDPIMIRELDPLLEETRERAEHRFGMKANGIHLRFRAYGRDAVMGPLEPGGAPPREIGLMVDAVAPTQELATGVAMYARGHLQHASYPGILTTAGNMAYPFSPFGIPVGPAHRFSVYHLMPLKDACEIFPMTLEEVRN
ncbi:acyclic terpene utilization AtuA family protein [Roseococcus sp.]|uniref:acyclic terpene utilization AtuA family protein n=1 Tax=Roseococcus sp. TaxID=2109646 RepID=UPI003BAD10B7